MKYMLIDGNALVHRGFHAVPPLNTESGEPTNAVYGFTMILLRAIKDLKPTHIACTFDLAGPTFRHEKYKEYKGTRVKSAPELYEQIPRIKEVVHALNIPIFEKEGFEADDLLGTIATHLCSNHDHKGEVMIVTGDLDTLQLVNKCIKIYTLRKGITDIAIYDEAAVRARYGLNPSQMIDYKALRGDPSDNIKGVAGIGEKGAADLIRNFKSLEGLYEAIHKNNTQDKIKPKTLQLLIDQEDQARLSYELSKIVCDVPVEINIPAYEFGQNNLNDTLKLFQILQFQSLISKLPKDHKPITVDHPKSRQSRDLPLLGEEGIDAVATSPTLSEGGTTTPNGGVRGGVLPSDLTQTYQLIDTPEKLQTLTTLLSKAKQFAIDTETTGLDPVSCSLVGVSFAVKEGEAYYVPAKLIESNDEIKSIISGQVKKIGHNIKFDYLALKNCGITMSGIYFDTMLASYLLNAGTRQHNLDALAFNELGYQMQPIEDLIGKGKNQITMDQVEVEKVSWYAAEDADMTLRLKQIYEQRLEQENLKSVFEDIEMPLIEVLAAMEHWGIKVSSKLLNKLSGEAEIEINDLTKQIYKLSGEEFNINSPKQLKEILFDKLGIIPIDNRKTKTGISTAAGELEKMLTQHPIIQKILEYRELTKLQSTYLEALPKLINKTTGRIHTNYNQTIAATGRLSSTDPNLQNIPVKGDGLGSEVRKAFVAEKGYQLLSLDYSQIELRIVAHLANDGTMLEVFRNGKDIHSQTAMAIFGVTEDKITKDMRRDAKTINFGILYGLSSFGLSSRIGEVSMAEAKDFIAKYFSAYPQVKYYIDQVKAEVNKNAAVKNLLGRVRKFPEIRSSQYFIRSAAERAAVNFPIQSLEADIIKVAMINIHKELKDKGDEIRLLLQVHDELVFEVKDDKVEHYAKFLKPIMEDAIKLSIPVVVEAKVGNNWGDMEDLSLWFLPLLE